MAMNMKTLTQAFAKTAAVIEKTVQTTVQEVTGPKPLQDYDLLDQIGSAGPALAWKLYNAKPRAGGSHQYPTVCVWVLDKRSLLEARARSGLPKAAEDSFFNVIRADATRLVRIRHPGVLHVIQALDENKNAMAMVTEPLFSSVANALGNVENISKLPKELKGMEMGLLEVKHGLLQLAETLDFLHNNARLIHRAISPESVLITASGAWKLGGFGFAISSDQASGDLAHTHAFHYSEYDVEDSILPLQPSLNYTAPELVQSKSSSVGWFSDIFSFGCLAYHLISHKPLFDCHNNVKMYFNTLNYLSSFSSIPPELVSDLQRMLSVNESFRPSAIDFTGSPFFREDTRLRALRFLDHLIERDNMQKSDFLKALADMWKDFDSRVLRYKVLPPLCAELRNLVMQPIILPMVLVIAESQEKVDFELSTLPALLPVLSSASGDTLLLLLRQAELIIDKTSHEHLISHVLPMLVRAYDDSDTRLQEEVLKKTVSLASHLDSQLVKQAIMPRVHSLALRTTVAAVRVNALLCLGNLVQSLDKPAVMEILQTVQRCTAVDRSPPTLMCTLRVANAILKQFGIEFTAEHVLPLLTPLLIAQQLNVQQFGKYMLFVKDILRKIEEKRGVSITESGFQEAGAPVPDGRQLAQSINLNGRVTASSPASNKSSTWDEDWAPTIRVPDSTVQSSTVNLSSIKPQNDTKVMNGQSILPPSLTPTSTSNPMNSSWPALDLEWPLRSSSSSATPVVQSNAVNMNTSTGNSLDETDPFADWPPRSQGSLSGISSLGQNRSSVSSIGDSWNNNTGGPALNSYVTSSVSSSNGGGVMSLNSLDYMKQDLPKATELSSIFASSKNDQSALRLAPPPSNPAIGRNNRVSGRGRGQLGSVTRPKPPSQQQKQQQPPLLDLL
ncbi:hypothetical protein V2J09_008585 [Rumex salicifolius]